ncbi:MAG: hypothetical protein V1818_02705 [Candidatus Aenigmatarchaeota archaeon]
MYDFQSLNNISKKIKNAKGNGKQLLDTFDGDSEDPPDSIEEKEDVEDKKSGVVYKLKTIEPEEIDYEIYKSISYEQFTFDWESLNTFIR